MKVYIIFGLLLFSISCNTKEEKEKILTHSEESVKDISLINSKIRTEIDMLLNNNNILEANIIFCGSDINTDSVLQDYTNVTSRQLENIDLCNVIDEFIKAAKEKNRIFSDGHDDLKRNVDDFIRRLNILIKSEEHKLHIIPTVVNINESDDELYINACLNLQLDLNIMTQVLLTDFIDNHSKLNR